MRPPQPPHASPLWSSLLLHQPVRQLITFHARRLQAFSCKPLISAGSTAAHYTLHLSYVTNILGALSALHTFVLHAPSRAFPCRLVTSGPGILLFGESSTLPFPRIYHPPFSHLRSLLLLSPLDPKTETTFVWLPTSQRLRTLFTAFNKFILDASTYLADPSPKVRLFGTATRWLLYIQSLFLSQTTAYPHTPPSSTKPFASYLSSWRCYLV
jgi:hypothetical protein